MAVKTYLPDEVKITFGVNILSGLSEATFVVAERRSDAFGLVIGADGGGTRNRTVDKSGTITVTLKQSSASNDVLSAIALIDENSAGGVFPLSIEDASGRTEIFCESAWIRKVPNAEFARDVSDREWIFETDNMVMYHGGND